MGARLTVAAALFGAAVVVLFGVTGGNTTMQVPYGLAGAILGLALLAVVIGDPSHRRR